MNTNGFVLCRPQGGINDMLCQIEHCCRYAEKFSRSVIVDTKYAKAIHFRDRFSEYFVSQQQSLILDATDADLEEANNSIFPYCVMGKVRDYDFHFSWDHRLYVESSTMTPLTFETHKHYPTKYLLHHTGGGGQLSMGALQRLRLHDSVVDLLIQRLEMIGRDYVGIHIRNTDYETDYHSSLHELKSFQNTPILVCTDSQAVLDDAHDILGADRVISFSNLETGEDKRIHFFSDDNIARRRNMDAIVDLLLLAFATYLITLPLKINKEAPHGGYSGFSVLADLLHNNRTTLMSIVGRKHRSLQKFSFSLI